MIRQRTASSSQLNFSNETELVRIQSTSGVDSLGVVRGGWKQSLCFQETSTICVHEVLSKDINADEYEANKGTRETDCHAVVDKCCVVPGA